MNVLLTTRARVY